MVVGIGQVWPIPRGPQSGCLSSLVRAPAVGGVRASSAAPPACARRPGGEPFSAPVRMRGAPQAHGAPGMVCENHLGP